VQKVVYLYKKTTISLAGRVTNIDGNNHLNPTSYSVEGVSKLLDNADNVVFETRSHRGYTGSTMTPRHRWSYDHWGRKTAYFLNANYTTGEKQHAQYIYNERDLLKELNLGKTADGTFLQSVDYTYNAQNWLRGINLESMTNISENDLFSLYLRYDTTQVIATNVPATARKNGDISQLQWRVTGQAPQAYGFEYDYLNRLTNAVDATINSATPNIGRYKETIGYADKRGNISKIQRNGASLNNGILAAGIIDNLTFNYFPNKNTLQAVTEAEIGALKDKGFKGGTGAGYTYDISGNLIADTYKGITIKYNHLNLPEKITKGNETIEWLYDAAGTKLQKKTTTSGSNTALVLDQNPIANGTYTGSTITSKGKATSGAIIFDATQSIDLNVGFEATPAFFAEIVPTLPSTTTVQDYAGGIEYKNGIIEALYHSEGRVYNNNNTWRYEYTIKDHLGNARVTFADNSPASLNSTSSVLEILQENHYYPFGMNQEGKWASTPNKYQYNGKELNEDLGLNWNHQDARFYDFAINRWSSVDPVTEGQEDFSPYHFSYDNPIRFSDPDGREPCCGGIIEEAGAFALGTFNAIGSNGLGGAGRQDPSTLGSMASSAAAGQAFGDRLSVVAGAFEMAAGVVVGGGGAALAPATVGASLAVSAGAVTAVAHGSVMAATALKQLGQDNGRVNSDLAKPGEDLYVGTFGQSRGGNIKSGLNPTHTPHHIVQDAVSSTTHSKGVTINLSKELHSQTATFKRPVRKFENPNNQNVNRLHLAADIKEMRKLLSGAGYKQNKINTQLKEVIKQNKQNGGFDK
jgi:RHS repeat-associated protein